jgi:hypothetical protein
MEHGNSHGKEVSKPIEALSSRHPICDSQLDITREQLVQSLESRKKNLREGRAVSQVEARIGVLFSSSAPFVEALLAQNREKIQKRDNQTIREGLLPEILKEAHKNLRIIMNYEKQSTKDTSPTLKDLLKTYEEIKRCSEKLNLLDLRHQIPKGYLGLKNLETRKNNKLKEAVDDLYASISPKMNYYQGILCQGLIKWVDRGKESGWLQIRQSKEYSRFKDISSEINQISMQMKELDQSKSTARESSQEMSKQKDQLLEHLVMMYREFSEINNVLRTKISQNGELKEQLIQKGQRIFEDAKTKSAERQERGMTGPVIEESWRTFYRYDIRKLEPSVWRREEFDELMEAGQLKGKESDYYTVVMEPRLPHNSSPFDKPRRPLMACVNPKDGVLVNIQANRETDHQWRKENFPEEFPPQLIDGIKKNLGVEKLPKEFFEPLQASDLSALAYRLAAEKYKEEQLQSGTGARNLLSTNDLSPAPLTEVVGVHIGSPETTVVLHKYLEAGEAGKPMIFKPGEEGFDLVSATHFGRRIPFMQADYRDIVGDGRVDQYQVDIVRGGEINIKGVIKPNNEASA